MNDVCCECCGRTHLMGYNNKIEPKHYICDNCLSIYEKVRALKSERDLYDNKPVFVVYALEKVEPFSDVWIESIYMDKDEGVNHMIEMQESEEYGHLYWSNKILKVKK